MGKGAGYPPCCPLDPGRADVSQSTCSLRPGTGVWSPRQDVERHNHSPFLRSNLVRDHSHTLTGSLTCWSGRVSRPTSFKLGKRGGVSPAPRVKDPVLSLLWLGSLLWHLFYPWPLAWPEKQKRKTRGLEGDGHQHSFIPFPSSTDCCATDHQRRARRRWRQRVSG